MVRVVRVFTDLWYRNNHAVSELAFKGTPRWASLWKQPIRVGSLQTQRLWNIREDGSLDSSEVGHRNRKCQSWDKFEIHASSFIIYPIFSLVCPDSLKPMSNKFLLAELMNVCTCNSRIFNVVLLLASLSSSPLPTFDPTFVGLCSGLCFCFLSFFYLRPIPFLAFLRHLNGSGIR